MNGSNSDAVMFFEGDNVVKEMLYPEFEAILDHVLGIDDFKSTTVPAVYLQIDGRLNIVAAVFFQIDYDENGYTDSNWNIPLEHLADTSGRGPDLGSGPIKLACRSQCSVPWHQRTLWDPIVDSDNSTFKQLNEKVKRNRLGIINDDMSFSVGTKIAPAFPEATEYSASSMSTDFAIDEVFSVKEVDDDGGRQLALEKKYQDKLTTKITQLKREQKLRLATMKSEAQDHIEKMQRGYQQQVQRISAAFESTKQLFTEEKQRNIKLKKKVGIQAEQFQQIRARFQEDVSKNQQVENELLSSLEEKYELELSAKLEAETAELKEMLDMREVELFYRDEQIGRLNTEITTLRQEKHNILQGGGDQVLKQLAESGITFVAYQPGVEHVTVPVVDMSLYLEAPMTYVAEKSGVDLQMYMSWISHNESPCCNYLTAEGGPCGKPVERESNPLHFISGETDRCSEHMSSAGIFGRNLDEQVF